MSKFRQHKVCLPLPPEGLGLGWCVCLGPCVAAVFDVAVVLILVSTSIHVHAGY
jgi:hypothetical protein